MATEKAKTEKEEKDCFKLFQSGAEQEPVKKRGQTYVIFNDIYLILFFF